MDRAADVVVVAGWTIVIAHNAWLAARGVGRPRGGPRWALGLSIVGAVVYAGHLLERDTGGRLSLPGLATVAGMLAALAGTALHVWARQTLAHAWAVRPDPSVSALVTHGPYRYVRHPIYAALLLLAVGTGMAHPSAATFAAGLGLVAGTLLKIRAEERTLAGALGARWQAYRARVPCLVPRGLRAP